MSMNYSGDEVDAYLVVYSVTDRSSFTYAQTCLADLKRRRKTLPPSCTSSAVLLVANKQDLVRNRVVSEAGQPQQTKDVNPLNASCFKLLLFKRLSAIPVSYTHLTLPTILRV